MSEFICHSRSSLSITQKFLLLDQLFMSFWTQQIAIFKSIDGLTEFAFIIVRSPARIYHEEETNMLVAMWVCMCNF